QNSTASNRSVSFRISTSSDTWRQRKRITRPGRFRSAAINRPVTPTSRPPLANSFAFTKAKNCSNAPGMSMVRWVRQPPCAECPRGKGAGRGPRGSRGVPGSVPAAVRLCGAYRRFGGGPAQRRVDPPAEPVVLDPAGQFLEDVFHVVLVVLGRLAGPLLVP